MGFLSGVLKDVSEKQPYSVGKTMLKNLVSNEINKHLCSGHDGFKRLFEKLPKEIEKYNREVRESNEKVSTPIKKLQEEIKELEKQVSDILNDNAVSADFDVIGNAVSQAMPLVQKSLDQGAALDNSLKNVNFDIIDLNANLSARVISALKSVRHENRRLDDQSKKALDDMMNMNAKITDVLANLRININEKIEKDVRYLVDALIFRVTDIKTKLEEINHKLEGYIYELGKLLAEAEEVISAMEGTLNVMYNHVNWNGEGEKPQKWKDVEDTTKEIDTCLVKKVEELVTWKQAADNIVQKATLKCSDIRLRVDESSNPKIFQTATDLKNKAEKLLTAYKDARAGVGRLVEAAKKNITTLEDNLKTDLKTLKDQIIDVISTYFDKFYRGAVKADLSLIAAELNSSAPKLQTWLSGYAKYNGSPKDSVYLALKAFQKNSRGSRMKYDESAYGAIQKDLNESVGKKWPDDASSVSSDPGDVHTQPSQATKVQLTNLQKYASDKTAVERAYTTVAEHTLRHFEAYVSKQNADKDVGAVRDQFMSIVQELYEITKLVTNNGGPGSKPDGVTNYLVELVKMLEAKECTLECNIDDSIKNEVRGLELLKNEISALRTQISVVDAKVNDLCEAVKVPGYYAKEHLKTLKEMMYNDVVTIKGETQRGINEVKNSLRTLRKKLGTAIQNVHEFITRDAKHSGEQTIIHLISYVNENIDIATSTLTTAARRNYVSSVKALLTAFADKVSQELAGLPEEIDRDLTIGFKGLMKTLEGTKYTAELSNTATFNDSNRSELFDKISELAKSLTSPLNGTQHLEKFKDLSTNFHTYFTNIHTYINNQITPENKTQSPTEDPNVAKLTDVKSKFTDLLDHLKINTNQRRTYIFDNTYTNLLSTLSSSLHLLHPSHFANPRHPELLDAVRAGLQGFVKEMERVYVNKYEGSENTLLVYAHTGNVTEDGKNCAKILMTILEMVKYDLANLLSGCDQYKTSKITLKEDNRFGRWFRSRGFTVSITDKQDGELRNSDQCTGNRIKDFLVGDSRDRHIFSNADIKTDNGSLSNLVGQVATYCRVTHLRYIEKPKAPSNIYQMLQWLSGLLCDPMLTKVSSYMKELFDKPEAYKDHADYSKIPSTDLKLSATREIAYDNLPQTLHQVCNFSQKTLVAILGRGHAGGRYACDFYTNVDNLLYPSRSSECFDMLVDMLNRVHHQLRFLYSQCQNGPDRSGWKDCWYGKDIGGSAWNCNSKQCPKQINGQECNQMVNQTADQTCNQHPNCGLKSPLQSFLEDGLPGFLPHKFDKPGCNLTCTVSKHRGIPCKTPMGFSDLGITASRAEKGSELWKLLYQFCGLNDKPLSTLCAQLNCLLRQPPQTLGDMFSFFQGYLSNWNGGGRKHKQEAFENAVKKANFNNAETMLDVTSIQQSSKHDSHTAGEKKQLNGDIFSLVECKSQTSMPNVPCGAYLQSISYDVRVVYSKECASQYLSWVVYISETFWDLLKQLYEQCCRNCNKAGTRCHDRSCVKDCQVNTYYGSPNAKYIDNIKHEHECNSIVTCRNTHAAIYAAGFTFGSPYELSGAKDKKTKRTCQDFCKALESICSDKSVLARLVHEYIPKFLWEIREKFFYTTVALWSLSLFYLICVMVGRLDVLHIRSHLRIPSSHKITAQSLLAAAQVGRLAKISYLQP
ncbi:hypothetical protein, conserved [Babesia bigemina]|nr:hypothetical protein, conserved [Babesia bigemina]CDR71726.1 hypothetical protein, conserved [Babesia bigemina]|eukprot:XP_012770672.1 hypothetical protein, conserved [Babesia bigemina]